MLNLPSWALRTVLVAACAVCVAWAVRQRRAIQQYGPARRPAYGGAPPVIRGYGATGQGGYGQQGPPIIMQFQQPGGYQHHPVGYNQRAQDCFPSDALVTTPQGPRRMMDIVNRTDAQVLVADEGNNLFFSPILLWIHKSPEYAKYIEMTTESGEMMAASKTHFVFRVPCNGGEKEALFAQDLTEKDCVLVRYGNMVVPRRVTRISQSYRHGRYQFLTQTGTVLVNNVLASTYSVIDDYEFQHKIFKGYYHIHKVIDRYLPYLAQMLDGDRKNLIVAKMTHLLDSGAVF